MYMYMYMYMYVCMYVYLGNEKSRSFPTSILLDKNHKVTIVYFKEE